MDREGGRRRRYILCYHPEEAERQKKHREQKIRFLEEGLERHPAWQANAQWAIELLASSRYKRYLTITKSNNIRIDRKNVRGAERHGGKWVLRTNDDTISVEDAACGYKGLMVIERIAEIICGEPWSRIRRKLEGLEIFELITPEYRFFRRNEIPLKTRNMLNIHGVSTPKFVAGLEKRQKTSLKS